MSPAKPRQFGDPHPQEVRQKRLQRIAWAATFLPLFAFGMLTWQSMQLEQRVQSSQKILDNHEKAKKQLQEEIRTLQNERASLSREKRHYRELAGVKVMFYRAQDKEVISGALSKLGLDAELRAGVRTISKSADTLAFGPEVSVSDCKAVATALVQAGFPIRSIVPARNIREARLLQIYASVRTDPNAPLYTPDRIEKEAVCTAPPQ